MQLDLFLQGQRLSAMQTPDTVIDLAETYIKIYFIGMIPNLYYNICAAILRAVGIPSDHSIF